MHRVQFRKQVAAAAALSRAALRRPASRCYQGNNRGFRNGSRRPHQPPKVRLLGPTIWCVAVSGAIYLGCAAYDVYEDVGRSRTRDTRQSGLFSYRPERAEFSDDPTRFATGLIAADIGVFTAMNTMPPVRRYFTHVAVSTRNYPMLTSTFGHAGLVHMGVNAYMTWQLALATAPTPTFAHGNAHMLAFYLSAGTFASLFCQAVYKAKYGPGRYARGLGASGALYALVGVFGATTPDALVSIVFTPSDWTFPISNLIAGVAVYETLGLLVTLPLTSPAHLGGLMVGVAYTSYEGHKRIWYPCRRFMLGAMQKIGVV